jgi:hypothetical protein
MTGACHGALFPQVASFPVRGAVGLPLGHASTSRGDLAGRLGIELHDLAGPLVIVAARVASP